MLWVITALALIAAPDLAHNDREAFVNSRLTGTWAQNCSKPPRVGNWYDVYELDEVGRISEMVSKSPGGPSRFSDLRRFRKLTDKLFAYTVTIGEEDLNLVVKVSGDRQRAWSSISQTNTVYIRNGKLVSNGTPTIWFHRCRM